MTEKELPRFGEERVVCEMWWNMAMDNIEEWGEQDLNTLLLAMQEELGELTQAYLEHQEEDGDFEKIGEELDDLAPLVFQFRRKLAQKQ